MSPLEKKDTAEEATPQQQEVVRTDNERLPCVQDAGEKPPLHTVDTEERHAMMTLLTGTNEQGEIQRETNAERKYVQDHPNWSGLEQRYTNPKTDVAYVQKQIQTFADARGLKHENPETLEGKLFSRETLPMVQTMVQKDIDRLLLDKEHGCHNPEKHKVISKQTERYLTLLAQAQEEGDVTNELSMENALQLVRENVWTLCYQDRVASENLLGDHGIRHLVQHNIAMTEKLFDELSRHGQDVKAIDRLMAHQVMIDHDIGYAMDPVREKVNTGDFAADRGHNVLSAKFMRQRVAATNHPFAKVFTEEHQQTIHQGILEHDSSAIDFRLHDTSAEGRKKNIHSAIHTADNSHAFEDKLPELLYAHPATLKYMRLMKSAGEIDDEELLEELKTELATDIATNEEYSEDDKGALIQAVQSLTKKSYAFSIGRICGNKPELTLDEQGTLLIQVQESAIHQEAVGLFGQKELDQLQKFAADFTGRKKEEIDLNVPEIIGENVRIVLKKEKENTTDYQQRVEELIRERAFRDYHERDTTLATMQKILQSDDPKDKELVTTVTLAQIKEERRSILRTYLSQ